MVIPCRMSVTNIKHSVKESISQNGGWDNTVSKLSRGYHACCSLNVACHACLKNRLNVGVVRFPGRPYKSRVRSFALNLITADFKFTRNHFPLCLLSFFDKAINLHIEFSFYNNWKNGLEKDYLTAHINNT
jgi:hypothetical protein